MQIGIPKELRARERRVALAPSGVRALVQQGHQVWVEAGAGAGAGFADADYESAGATIVFGRLEAILRSEILACVHAPEPAEYELLQPGQTVIAFWALPTVRPDEIAILQERGITAIGLEVIEEADGSAPVLTAMSEIAGGLAAIIGASLLLNEFGGKGILIGGTTGVPQAQLVILGAGVLGRAAARVALGLGAQVTMLDTSIPRLRAVVNELGRPVTTMLSTLPNLEKALSFADLVLGAVAVHGQRAPLLVTREMLAGMKPRTVVMDLSIDMGGCFETSRPTAFPEATYVVDEITHFCVPNLPSIAARSATVALTNAQLPFLERIAGDGLDPALAALPQLRRGLYLLRGRCARASLAQTHELDCEPPAEEAG
ncbi:MAG TPA: alanine dehydrogenase [Thermoanaerobaculia bacterium]|nr:alanine dehydrogenase [Thermoanaerobaculia bacterium]